jgi:hypothetical protein
VVSEPGADYEYSNLGYAVLDHLIGRSSARSYAEFMRDEVFAPLAMKRTTIGVERAERDDYAIRYLPDGTRLPYYGVDHEGASAVFSSARDLAAFGLFHVSRPLPGSPNILSRQAVEQMQRPTAETETGEGYGIGWQIRSGRYRVVSHGGGMPGVSTQLTLIPTEGLAVAVLANTSTPLVHEVTRRVLQRLLPDYRAASTRAPNTERGKGGKRISRTLIGHWTGSVESGDREVPLQIRIGSGGDVFVRLDGQEEARGVGVAFHDHGLRAFIYGPALRTRDTDGSSHFLRLVLTRRGGSLGGSLTAIAPFAGRRGFALTHWVALRADAISPGARTMSSPR